MSVSAMVNHDRIKLPSARVPGEGHFGGGACYTKASPLFPRIGTVVVITQLPLGSTLRSTDYAGRIAEWGTILGVSNIKYMPRTSVKGLVLTGLVARFAESPLEKKSRIKAWMENWLAQSPCKNFYSRRNILISSNLLKRLNKTLAMPGPQTSCFREINTHWNLLKWLNNTLAMPGPQTSCFGEINTHWHLLKRLNRTLAMPGPRTSCFGEINMH